MVGGWKIWRETSWGRRKLFRSIQACRVVEGPTTGPAVCRNGAKWREDCLDDWLDRHVVARREPLAWWMHRAPTPCGARAIRASDVATGAKANTITMRAVREIPFRCAMPTFTSLVKIKWRPALVVDVHQLGPCFGRRVGNDRIRCEIEVSPNRRTRRGIPGRPKQD